MSKLASFVATAVAVVVAPLASSAGAATSLLHAPDGDEAFLSSDLAAANVPTAAPASVNGYSLVQSGGPTDAAEPIIDEPGTSATMSLAVSMVPDAGSWALMLLGLTGVGGVMRARARRRAVPA